MKETIENDEDYNQMLADKEKEIELQKQQEDEEKQLEQKRIEYIKNIYPKLPKIIADSLSGIDQINHRGQNAYQFDFMMPNNYLTRIHAYKNDLDELESLYNDLKNKKQNKTTEDIYKYVCGVSANSIMSGYEHLSDKNGVLLGNGSVFKDWNIKQLPLYNPNAYKIVELALN